MSDSYDPSTHQPFVMDELLPLMARYAAINQHPTEVVLVASLAAITIKLLSKGYTAEKLHGFMATLEARVKEATIQ